MSVQTVSPTTTAISLDAAKLHLRQSDTRDDHYITALIDVATLSVEEFARRALIHQTRRMDLPEFSDEIRTDYGTLVSASLITYTTAGGTTSTSLAATVFDVDTSDARILLAYDQTWPTTLQNKWNAVQINYTVGFASSSSGVPANYKHALKLMLDQFYDQRSEFVVGTIVSTLPWGVKELIRPTRNFRFV